MMGVEDWEQLRDEMEKQRVSEAGGQKSSDSAYVSEGQQGYAAVDKEEE